MVTVLLFLLLSSTALDKHTFFLLNSVKARFIRNICLKFEKRNKRDKGRKEGRARERERERREAWGLLQLSINFSAGSFVPNIRVLSAKLHLREMLLDVPGQLLNWGGREKNIYIFQGFARSSAKPLITKSRRTHQCFLNIEKHSTALQKHQLRMYHHSLQLCHNC